MGIENPPDFPGWAAIAIMFAACLFGGWRAGIAAGFMGCAVELYFHHKLTERPRG